jgi:hypothetical protein
MRALPHQQRTETVREVFLDYFVSLLRPYRRFLLVPTADTINEYSDYYVEACPRAPGTACCVLSPAADS